MGLGFVGAILTYLIDWLQFLLHGCCSWCLAAGEGIQGFSVFFHLLSVCATGKFFLSLHLFVGWLVCVFVVGVYGGQRMSQSLHHVDVEALSQTVRFLQVPLPLDHLTRPCSPALYHGRGGYCLVYLLF